MIDCLISQGLERLCKPLTVRTVMQGVWRSNFRRDVLWYSRATGSRFFGEEARLTSRRHGTTTRLLGHGLLSLDPSNSRPLKRSQCVIFLLPIPCRRILTLSVVSTVGGYTVKGSTAEVYIAKRTHLNNQTQKDNIRHFAISEAHLTVKKLQEIVRPDVRPDTTELEDADSLFHLLFGAEENGWPKRAPMEEDVY